MILVEFEVGEEELQKKSKEAERRRRRRRTATNHPWIGTALTRIVKLNPV